jgi:uronate dehydrogenase
MHRVLITGAGGGIGRSLRETLRGVYPVLRVSDRVPLAAARDGEEVDQTDIADMAAVKRMVAGVDGIVHLGGISGENSWEKILEGNIIGLYNLFEAARRAGVRRIGFLCTRIGNFGTKPIDSRRLAIWISPRDYTQLVRIGLEHPDIRFEIVYGVSNNKRSWYDNANAYRLGYRPEDDSEPCAAEILAAEAGQTKDPVAERYQGGTFCAAEYDAPEMPE